jgi:uncharacterized protein YyaL (SSP411 family)
VTLHWHDWSDAAFAQARERRVPVLLVVHAHWCRFSRELERRVLRDASVVERIERGFVAISVEKSRRPDIAVRYSRGGWPTLAFLDEQGELFASEGFLEPEELAARLDLIERYWRAECGSLRARLAQRAGLGESGAVARAELKPELLAEIGAHLLETSDPYHGGWGSQHKFPHPESLDFALLRWSQTGDEALRKLVLRTLRNMQSGEIHDRVEGGFYRYSTAPDWSGPHHEKVLDGNAERLRSYLEGYQALGDASFKTTAEGVLDWMQTTLLDRETGAFRGSQDADPVYAHLRTREARAQHGAPECDPTIFAHANACAASALFLAGDVLERPECTEQAVRTLEFSMHSASHGTVFCTTGTASPISPGCSRTKRTCCEPCSMRRSTRDERGTWLRRKPSHERPASSSGATKAASGTRDTIPARAAPCDVASARSRTTRAWPRPCCGSRASRTSLAGASLRVRRSSPSPGSSSVKDTRCRSMRVRRAC